MRKKIGSFLMLLGIVIGWSSCSDNNSVADDKGGSDSTQTKTTIEIVQGEGDPNSGVYATSADFTLNLEGVSQYAYVTIPDDSIKGELTGKDVFLKAQTNGDSIYTAKAGKNNVSIYGLDGKTKYTTFFGFKVGNDYEVKKQSFTTPAYSQRITVVKADWNTYKVHFEVPDTMYYRYTFMDADTYWAMKEQFYNSDYGYLDYNGDLVAKGPKTVELTNGGLANPDNEESVVSVLPGSRYYVLLGECDKDGHMKATLGTGGGGDDGGVLMSSRPDLGDYTEKYTDDDLASYDGWFARQDFWTKAPEHPENQLTITQQSITERHANYSISLNPDDDMIGWGYIYLPTSEVDHIKTWVGDKGLYTYLLTNCSKISGPQDLSLELGKDENGDNMKYKLYIFGVYNDDLTKYSIWEQDVEAIKSNKPRPKMEVTAVNTGDPWSVTYRVKCTSKDCKSLRYLMNDEIKWKQVESSLQQSGSTIEDFFNSQATSVTDESELAQVNSDEGLEMTFSSYEATAERLVVAGLNEDEAQGDLAQLTYTTPEENGTPIQSSLFTDLAGDWTATYKTYDTSGKEVEKKFKVTIGGKPGEVPSSFNSGETYDAIVNWFIKNKGLTEDEAKQQVATDFATFKDRYAHFTEKYRNLNRLVIQGFEPLNATYKDPFNLFTDTGYSSYTVDELFYDYGPKLFFQVGKDKDGKDTLALFTNPSRVAPMMAWKYYDYYMIGYSKTAGKYITSPSFHATVSDDKKTITIGGVDYGGNTYYPSVGYFSGQYAYTVARGSGVLTLTKGWTDGSSAFIRPNWTTGAGNSTITPNRGNGRFMKTKFILPRVTRKSVVVKPFQLSGQKVSKTPKVFKWK